MKNRSAKLLSLLTSLLTAAMLLSCMAAGIAEETVDIPVYSEFTVRYPDGATGRNYTTGFLYNDNMLMQDSGSLSTDLAKASVALAMAAYDFDSIHDVLDDMGYLALGGSYSYSIADNAGPDDCDHVGYTIAHKIVDDYIIYCVPVRGTSQNCEWFSDFDVGTSGKHKGFYAAASELQGELYSDLRNDGFPADKTIIWTMGHSRGAAVSNIVAGELTRSGEYALPHHIFSYNFACPAVSKEAAACSNIFNFNGAGDAVPAIPLTAWGYQRYGQSITLHRQKDSNFTSRFASVTGTDFGAAESTAAYTSAINALVPSDKDFEKEIVQLAAMFVAYQLGGKNDASWEEVWDAYDINLGAILKEMLGKDKSLVLILKNKDEKVEVITKLRNFMSTNSASVYRMTMEEFARFKQENLSQINSVSDYTGLPIDDAATFEAASMAIDSLLNEVVDVFETISSFVDVYIGKDGNILDAVADAHTQAAYILAINSKYYGYEGWYGSNISSFELPENCTSVGYRCFYACEKMEKLTLHENTKVIAEGAFHGCSSLTELVIPRSVKQIGKIAFGKCTGLRTVTMPVELSIAARFTSDCKVESIHYTVGSTGVMPDRDLDYHFNNPDYYYQHCLEFFSAETLKSVVFDEGISNIASYTFFTNGRGSALERVTLPSTLQSIGNSAFKGTVNLATEQGIVLPEGITSLGTECFSGSGIAAVTLPESLTAIPDMCFMDCSNMTILEILQNTQSIGKQAFERCTGLTEITLPVELSVADVFNWVSNVHTIHYTYNSDGVMPDRFESGWATDHYYRSTLEFYSRAALKHIEFAEGVTHIGDYTYYHVNQGMLESVSLPGTLKSIGDYAFCNQPNLNQELELPEGLTELGLYSFSKCGFTAIRFPSTLSCIPEGCFQECTSFDTLIIPDTVMTMGRLPFWGCSGVKHVQIPVELSTKEVLDSTQIEDIIYTANSTGIMPDRFEDKYSNDTSWTMEGKSRKTLKAVEFAEGVTHIAAKAFDAGVDEGFLESLKLPSTLQSIGNKAFYSQPSLAIDLVLPEGVTAIGMHTFYNCAFTNITLPESLLDYPESCFEGCRNAAEINFPNAPLNIGKAAFKNCDSITELVIPNRVQSLGRDAFADLNSLQHLTMPVELSAPYTVSDGYPHKLETIHYTCSSTGIMPDREEGFPCMNTAEYIAQTTLKTVILDEGVKHIGDRAFYRENRDDSGLESITLPGTLESIGDYAFYRQSKLVGPFVLPEGFKELGVHSFDQCTALTGITLPEGIEEIPDWCFHSCDNLRTKFPESLRRIGKNAFLFCKISDDGKLVIPRGMEYVGTDAFTNCNAITDITLPVELDAPGAFNMQNVERIHYTVGSDGIMPDRCNDYHKENDYANYLENRTNALISVDFEEGVKHIGAYVFYNDRYTTALKEITLPSTLESIGDYAFYNRESLKSIRFPASLEKIGNSAFKNCIPISEIIFEGPAPVIGDEAFAIGWNNTINTHYYPSQGGWSSSMLKDYGTPMTWIIEGENIHLSDGRIRLVLSDCGVGNVVPLKIHVEGVEVTADAVWTSSDAEVVTVANGVLTAVGEGSAVVHAVYSGIEMQCLVQVLDVPFLHLPVSTLAIEAEAFSGLKELQAVALGSQVNTIGEKAFTGCSGLLVINLPASVTEIAEDAFAGCDKLRIFCDPGSAGEAYAAAQGIPYTIITSN